MRTFARLLVALIALAGFSTAARAQTNLYGTSLRLVPNATTPGNCTSNNGMCLWAPATGQLTVGINSTTYFSVLSSAPGTTVLQLDDGVSASASAANTGAIIYDNTLHMFRGSANTGAYDTIATLTAAQEMTNKTLTGMLVKNGLTASGTSTNDFSGSTGAFKTSTGVNTFGGSSNLFSAAISDSFGVSATTVPGMTLATTLPASNGNQKYSPATVWTGFGWDSTAVASKEVDWEVHARPVQQTSNPSGDLVFSMQTNGGGWTEVFSVAANDTNTVFELVSPQNYWGLRNGSGSGIAALGSSMYIYANAGPPLYVFDTGEFNPVNDNAQQSGDIAHRWAQTVSNITLSYSPSPGATTVSGLQTGTGPATVGTVLQYSPLIELDSSAWDTGALISDTAKFAFQNRPVSVSGSPTASLTLMFEVSGGPYNDRYSYSSTGTFKTSRVSDGFGTALIAGDFALSGGWGASGTISSLSGTDGAWKGTVTASGAGLVANPTLTLTFHDGTWTSAPVCSANLTGTADATNLTTKVTWTTSATQLAITFNGTPVASTYVFDAQCTGVQ